MNTSANTTPTKRFHEPGRAVIIRPFDSTAGHLSRSIPPWSIKTLRNLGLPDDKIATYFTIWSPDSRPNRTLSSSAP